MSKRFDLEVQVRTTGKAHSRELRNRLQVPAVVYGTGKNFSVFLDERAVIKYNTRAFENSLFNLKSSDGNLNGVVSLMKDVQVHPVTRRPQHVDFYALDLTKAVRVSVEVRLEGKPVGIADGGLLNAVNRQVEIECLPTAIPESFVLDVSDLGIGDSKHVSDLKVPAGVKLISSPDLTLAVVNLFVEEVIATPTAADAAATPAEGAAAAGAAPAAGADGKAAPAAAGDKAAAAKAPAKK